VGPAAPLDAHLDETDAEPSQTPGNSGIDQRPIGEDPETKTFPLGRQGFEQLGEVRVYPGFSAGNRDVSASGWEARLAAIRQECRNCSRMSIHSGKPSSRSSR